MATGMRFQIKTSQREDGKWIASLDELNLTAEGDSEQAAKEAIAEKMKTPDNLARINSLARAPAPPTVAEDKEEEEDEDYQPAHLDVFEEYVRGTEQKKSLSKLPKLIKTSLQLSWSSGPTAFVFASFLLLVNGAGAGLQLLVGKDALSNFLQADRLGRGLNLIIPQLLIFGAVTAVMKISQAFQGYFQEILQKKTSRRAMEGVLDVAAAVDLQAFEQPDFFDRLKRSELNSQMRPHSMVWGLFGMIGSTFGLIGISVSLFIIKPFLLPLVLVAYLPIWFAKRKGALEMWAQFRDLSQLRREKDYLRTVLTGRDEAKEVRAFGIATLLRRRYDDLYDHEIAESLKLARRNLGRSLTSSTLTILMSAGVLLLLAWLVLHQGMAISAAAAAVAAIQMMSTRIEGVLNGATNIFETSLFLEDYQSFIDLRPVIEEKRPTGMAPEGFRRLEVRDVAFSYPGSKRQALKGVSLEINRGEIIALVGENGSGKTTLAKLLAQLYPPSSGRILWDGTDTADLEPDGLRKSIALIFQDFVKFKLTARENIGMGRHDKFDDVEAIFAAARRSGADSFMRKLPQGYETILAKEFKGGRDLSVGQWQRVALARAFFRDAPFIILDEPTAALDPRAEKELFDHIRELTEGRSVLLISHRFSSVRSADRIYVLQEGTVVEDGTHEELMRNSGLYAELFTMQASAYLN